MLDFISEYRGIYVLLGVLAAYLLLLLLVGE